MISPISKSQTLALAAVILFALAIIFPAASTARSSSKSTLCLANLHILGKAWLTYQEDNDSGWMIDLSNKKSIQMSGSNSCRKYMTVTTN